MKKSEKSQVRLLTKSRFKLGIECPTKLFYTSNNLYGNINDENEFLKALAEGGYQVGELAKLYHPNGIAVEDREYESAKKKTFELLEEGISSIYEGAVFYKQFFARIDLLVRKSQKSYDLIEVKAKSFDPDEDDTFWNKVALKKGIKELKAKWEPYVLDIAFQTLVARKAYPKIKFEPFLLLVDKRKMASVDGLNQLFPISKDENGRTIVATRKEVSIDALGETLLIKIPVGEVVDHIIEESVFGAERVSFEEHAVFLADLYLRNYRHHPEPTNACKGCEFKTEDDDLKNGFVECWKEAFNASDDDLREPLVTELWKFNSDSSLRSGIYKLRDLPESAIKLKESQTSGLSQSERQLLQLQKVKNLDSSLFIDVDSIKREITSWEFPLHFIDFETTTVAVPFHKGQQPYQPLAFQFSHHQMERDGTYRHKSQFLHMERGKFPNFEFIRALRLAVSDKGSIFRYTSHENTILNTIAEQLRNSSENDKEALIEFIESITKQKISNDEVRVGERCMIDLFDILKKFYFDPSTRGSNSLKYVFPAVLNRSKYLKEKYSNPIYGIGCEILSLNFDSRVWIKKNENGSILNPYKDLPPVLSGFTILESERIFSNTEIREGGSASIAYARMQFEEMKDAEKNAIKNALLRYCELDTLAMVMLVEHWMYDFA